MSQIISRYRIGTSLFLGGSFVLFTWLTFITSSPPLPSPENPLLFYSNQTQQDLRVVLCSALKNSKKSIDLHIYSLTDPEILSLVETKEKEGVATSIVYDKSASKNLNKTFHFASPDPNKGLMHRKIFILDGSQVFIGTANLTPQSLSMHDNLIVGLYHPPLASFLKAPASDYFSFSIQNQEAELWMLPSKSGLNRLIQLIDNAKKSLHIAMFTFTHPALTDALIRAHKRGVEVQLAVDFHTGHGSSLKAFNQLKEANLPCLLSHETKLLHHKWALIDQQTLLIGSANWTQAAFSKNKDCFLLLHSLTGPQKAFLKKLWSTIKREAGTMDE